MAQPSSLPRWAQTTGGTPSSNIVTPPSGQLDSGWATNQVPPSGWFNWFMNLTFQWLAYLQTLSTNALNWTALQTFSSGATANYIQPYYGILGGGGNLSAIGGGHSAYSVPTAISPLSGALTTLSSNSTDVSGLITVFSTTTSISAGATLKIAHIALGNVLLPVAVFLNSQSQTVTPLIIFSASPSTSGGNGFDVYATNVSAGTLTPSAYAFNYLTIL